MCDSKLPADDSHEQASRLSALDLYEDLLIKEDSQDGNRVLSMQEIMMEKRTLQEQNTLLLQQLMESKLQAQKLLDERTNLKKNFESLLATAKVELQRKNDLLSRYIGGSSGAPVGPTKNPTQSNPKPGVSKENNKKKGLLDLYKGRRVNDEELVAMKSGNNRIPPSTSPALLQHRGEKMVGVATRVIGSSFENIGDTAARNLTFNNSPSAGTQSTDKPDSSSSNARCDIRTSLSVPSVEGPNPTPSGKLTSQKSDNPTITSTPLHSRLVEMSSIHNCPGTSDRKSPKGSSKSDLSDGEIEDSETENGCMQKNSVQENFKTTSRLEIGSVAIHTDDGKGGEGSSKGNRKRSKSTKHDEKSRPGTSKPNESQSSNSGILCNPLRATNTATDMGQKSSNRSFNSAAKHETQGGRNKSDNATVTNNGLDRFQSSNMKRSDKGKQTSSGSSDKTIHKRKNSLQQTCDTVTPPSDDNVQPAVDHVDLRASPEVYSMSMYESRRPLEHPAGTIRHNVKSNANSDRNSLETEWKISSELRKDLKSDSRRSKSRSKSCNKDDKKCRKSSVDCVSETSGCHVSKRGEGSSKRNRERSKSTKHGEKSHHRKSHSHDVNYAMSESAKDLHDSVKFKSSRSGGLGKGDRKSSKQFSGESFHYEKHAENLQEKQKLAGDMSSKDRLGKPHQKHTKKRDNAERSSLSQKLLSFAENDIHGGEKSRLVVPKSKKHQHDSDKHRNDSKNFGSGSMPVRDEDGNIAATEMKSKDFGVEVAPFARVRSPKKSHSLLSGGQKKKISLAEYRKNTARSIKSTSSETGLEHEEHKALTFVKSNRKSSKKSLKSDLSDGEIEDSEAENECMQKNSAQENFKTTSRLEIGFVTVHTDDGSTRASLSDGEIIDSPKKDKSRLFKKGHHRRSKPKSSGMEYKSSKTPAFCDEVENTTTVSLSDGEVVDSPLGEISPHDNGGQQISPNNGEVIDDALDLELDYDENSLMYRDLIHPDDVKPTPEVESYKDSKIHREKSDSKQSEVTEEVNVSEHHGKDSSDGTAARNRNISMEVTTESKSLNLPVTSPVKVSSSIISSPQYQPKVQLVDIGKSCSDVLKRGSLKKRKISRESLGRTPKKTKLTETHANNAKGVNKIYFDSKEANTHIDSGAITSTLNEISKALCSSVNSDVKMKANSTEDSANAEKQPTMPIEKQPLSSQLEGINTDCDIPRSQECLVINESVIDNSSDKNDEEFGKLSKCKPDSTSQNSAVGESTPFVAAMMDVAMEVEVAPSSGVEENSVGKNAEKSSDVEEKNRDDKTQTKVSGNLDGTSSKRKSSCMTGGNSKKKARKRKLKIKMKPFVKSRRKSHEKTQNTSTDSANAISITDVVASLPDVEDSNSVPEPPPLLNEWLASARESRRKKRKREKEMRLKKGTKGKGEKGSKGEITDDANRSFTCETVSDCNAKIKIHVTECKKTEKSDTQIYVKREKSYQPTLFPIVGGEGDIMRSYRNAALQWLLHMVDRKLKTIDDSSSEIPLDLSVKKDSNHASINIEEKESVKVNLFSKPKKNTVITSKNKTDIGFDKLLQEHKEKQKEQTAENTGVERSKIQVEKRKPRRVALERVEMPLKENPEHSSAPNIMSPPSRTVWMSSLEKCQARRKQQSRWSSEIDHDTENENDTTQPETDSKLEISAERTQILKAPSSTEQPPNKSAILPATTPVGLQELSGSSSLLSVSDLIPDISSSSWQLSEESRHRFYSFAKVVKLLSPLKRSPRKISHPEESSL